MIDRWFRLNRYPTRTARLRAQMTLGSTLMLLVVYTLYIFLVPSQVRDKTFIQELFVRPDITFYIFAFYTIGAATMLLLRAGRLEWAAWGPTVIWMVSISPNIMLNGVSDGFNGLLLVGTVLSAGLLKGARGTAIGTVMALLTLGAAIWQRPYIPQSVLPPYVISGEMLADSGLYDLVALSLMLMGVGGGVLLFQRYSALNREEGATSAIEDREVTAQIINQIAALVVERVPLETLLQQITQSINERFSGIYHCQVFLIDDAQYVARLAASTGEVGRLLMERGHQLTVGSASVIGQVTETGQPVIAAVGERGGVHQRNELLPDTVIEAAFPLRLGQKVIGALDLQSTHTETFSSASLIATLQALADSISLAIDNLSQFKRAEERVRENEKLVQEARGALREVERLNERLTGRAWSDYLRGFNHDVGLTLDFENEAALPLDGWTPTLREAIRNNYMAQTFSDEGQVIALPLRVRGRVIGAMEFDLPAGSSFSPEDFELVQEISQRFGLAVENARLVDESQRAAQREALVNQITSRLQSSNSVDEMLSEAVRSLGSALRTRRVSVRLGSAPR